MSRIKAAMSTGAANDLPDSAFAYIEPGGTKDKQGRTTPRSLRHFPIHDKAHVRNALARLDQSPFGKQARAKVEAAAKRMGIGEPAEAGKKGSIAAGHLSRGANALSNLYDLISCEADEPDQLAVLQQAATSLIQWMGMEQREVGQPDDDDGYNEGMVDSSMKARAFGEMKAEPMNTSQLDSWLAGRIPRRMLAIPYGGPVPAPGAPLGVDVDGEWFSPRTDLYGGHKALLATRERLVDFHHRQDPTGVMGDAVLGKAVADETAEADGLWVDLWANAGEQRLRLVGELEKRGARLYGSSESAPGWRVNKASGEILLWPWVRQTISTSPQNTLAVMPPLKALLSAGLPLSEVGLAAVKAALVGLGSVDGDTVRDSARQRLTTSGVPGDGQDDETRLLQAVRDARTVIRAARDVLPTSVR